MGLCEGKPGFSDQNCSMMVAVLNENFLMSCLGNFFAEKDKNRRLLPNVRFAAAFYLLFSEMRMLLASSERNRYCGQKRREDMKEDGL